MIIVILMLMAFGAYWLISEVIRFRHYDYRQEERTGISNRANSKDIDIDEIWLQNWEYDPETKSFKNKREPR